MGLTSRVREANTTEEGTAYLGADGKVLGSIPADQEQDGPTAELEILRGDLAGIISDALPDDVTMVYGDRVATVDDDGDGVRVVFESGRKGRYDLLIVAEGVRSSTRDLVFGDAVERRPLGLNMAYGTIPRTEDDDRWWRWYTAPGRRGVTLRPDNVGTTRATLAYVDHEHAISDLELDEARAELARRFEGAGWEADRVVKGFAESDDVYMDGLTQIRMPAYARGRVVLTGDAAWCVTPLAGGGTSLALVGGYVLAASLDAAGDDLQEGFRRYEEWMRPFVEGVQDLPKGTPDLFYPESPFGVGVLRTMQRVMASPPFRRIGARAAHVAQTDQKLPEPAGSTA
jgi:2-polyprenyl-6-methoxyphenol hydroxylase-like FAD-dependent oxidoreductase